MTLKYIWRSFQPRLSFPRPFQLSLVCFRVARSPSNSWASCSISYTFFLSVIIFRFGSARYSVNQAGYWSICKRQHRVHVLPEYLATHLTSLVSPWMLKCLPLNWEHWRSRKSVEPGGQSCNTLIQHATSARNGLINHVSSSSPVHNILHL